MSSTESVATTLPEPTRAELRLEDVLGVLSDPLRLGMVRKLLLESPDTDRSCGWFEIDRPKSTLTHHFRVLREAGVTRQRQYGLSGAAGCGSRTSTPAFPDCSIWFVPGSRCNSAVFRGHACPGG